MVFSILALLAVCISICIKDRKKSLYVQSLNCFFETIYDFLISAFTGAILSIINLIRTFIFINKNKFSKSVYLIILFIFEGIIMINCYFFVFIIYFYFVIFKEVITYNSVNRNADMGREIKIFV